MNTIELLTKLCEATGVAGREGDAAAVAAELLSEYGTVTVTPLGSVLCTLNGSKEGGAHLMLDAHLDEIGMVVTYMEKSGFLRVAPCGGVDRSLLSAAQVTVHTQSGVYKGVVASIPPHLKGDGEEKNPKVEEIFIDIGYPYEKAKELVRVGDIVTLDAKAQLLANGLFSCKATDDRAGCAALILVAKLLQEKELPCKVTIALTSMEETGGAGAKAAAQQLMPTHAIAVDVSFGYTPDAKRHQCGEIKQGPMIGMAPILNRKMIDELIRLAHSHEIPHQYEAMGSKTGTNADEIAVAGVGVYTGLISIPQKYMHTPIETVAMMDIEQTAKLIAAYVLEGTRN